MSNNTPIVDNKFLKILNSDTFLRTVGLIHSTITNATFEFFRSKGIISVHLPVTTGSVTSPMGLGSDSLPVKIKLFENEVYLADSMQFHLEYLLRLFPDKLGVHYVMPTFRGEETDKRHLSQFYHSESEINGTLEDVMILIDDYLKFLCHKLLEEHKEFLLSQQYDLTHIENFLKLNIPRVRFHEIRKLLNDEKAFVKNEIHNFYQLTNLGEKKILEHYGSPVWVTNYPAKSVPFYQKLDDDKETTRNADLLMGIGEVVGCGERCDTVDEVLTNMSNLNVDRDQYEWYLQMKTLSPKTTSGFGLGVERFIMWILGCEDIRKIPLISRSNNENIVP